MDAWSVAAITYLWNLGSPRGAAVGYVGELWARYVETAEGYGFSIAANVLDAVNYGVPQYRRRAFVMGSRHGARVPSFPMPSHWCFIRRNGRTSSDSLHRQVEICPVCCSSLLEAGLAVAGEICQGCAEKTGQAPKNQMEMFG